MDKINNLKQWHQKHQKLFNEDETNALDNKFKLDIQKNEMENNKKSKSLDNKLHWQKCYNDSIHSNSLDNNEKENINPHERMVSKVVLSLDDLPVCGISKNFTELLNDKLELSNPEESEQSAVKPKRQFLKKGQGLARFQPGSKILDKKQSEKNKKLIKKKTIVQSKNKKISPNQEKKNFKHSHDREINKVIQQSKDEQSKNDSLRMFEKLEQHVANTSLSSTNNLVQRLMQTCVQTSSKNQPFGSGLGNEINIEKHLIPEIVEPESYLSKKNEGIEENFLTENYRNSKEKINERKFPNRKTFVIKRQESEDINKSFENENEILPYGTDIEEEHEAYHKSVRFTDQDKKFNDQEEWGDGSSIIESQEDLSNLNIYTKKHREIVETNPVIQKKSILKDGSKIMSQMQFQEAGDNECKKSNPFFSHFEPNLLKQSLVELQKEIEMFRSENEQLSRTKRELEKEQISLKKEKRELEKKMSEERKMYEENLKQEKAKLAKERKVWESMKERKLELESNANMEIEQLKQQIKLLQEEKCRKSERESSSLVRYREKIKSLERENELIKDENEQLKKRIKHLEQTRTSRTKGNTKSIHDINETLSKQQEHPQKDEKKRKDHDSLLKKNTEISSKQQENPQKDEKKRKDHDSLPKNSSEILLKYCEKKSDEKNEKTPETHKKDVHKKDNPTTIDVYDLLYENNDNEKTEKINTPTSLDEPSLEIKNNKQIKTWSDGRKEIIYPNKNLKKISADGKIEKLIYPNGDVKEVNKIKGTTQYFYSQNKVYETTYHHDKLQVLEFPNGQIEKRWPNGRLEITLNDGTIKIKEADGSEKCVFPDGTSVNQQDGEKIINFPNGQREIHTKDYKRREYPDGTVKFLYENGTYETRYADGRIKIKDSSGNIIKVINKI